MWKTLEADGCTWEARAVASEGGDAPHEEILEFRPRQPISPPRRIAIERGSLERMSDEELLLAYQKARPIGADFYGRPGKKMGDAPELK